MLDLRYKESLPQYQGDGAWKLVDEFWVPLIYFWIPLLIASFATGVTAIVKNMGRTEGIIALSVISIFVLLQVIQ